MSWRKQVREWAGRKGRLAREYAGRVSEQAFTRARQAGRVTARKVVAIQRAARLNAKQMDYSARSVRLKQMTRAGDRAWQAAYVAEADGRTGPLPPGPRTGELAGPDRDPDPGPRPSWPYGARTGRDTALQADREAGQ